VIDDLHEPFDEITQAARTRVAQKAVEFAGQEIEFRLAPAPARTLGTWRRDRMATDKTGDPTGIVGRLEDPNFASSGREELRAADAHPGARGTAPGFLQDMSRIYSVSTASRRALYGKLSGDTTLNNLLGTPASGYSKSIYHQQAPANAQFPFVVFQKSGSRPKRSAPRAAWTPTCGS
jgi:hypothetical protein